MSQMNEEEDLGNYSDKEPDVVEDEGGDVEDEDVDDEVIDDENDSINISEDEDFDDLAGIEDDDVTPQVSTDDVVGVEETKGSDNPNMSQNISYYISDDDSDDEEDYLYKLDQDVKNDFISKLLLVTFYNMNISNQYTILYKTCDDHFLFSIIV